MRSLTTLATTLVTSLLVPAAALAQAGDGGWIAPGGPPAAPPPAAIPAATVEASTADPGQLDDANIDRTFLMPTAMTQPKGSVSFNDYELIFMGLTYGVSDDLQLTGTTMVPLGDDAPFFGALSAKWRFLKAGRLRLAGQAGAVFVQEPDWGYDDSRETNTAFTLGGLATLCLDEGCHSLANFSVTSAFTSEGFDGDGQAVIYGASLVKTITPRAKLLLEVVSAGVYEDDAWQTADAALLSYGIRFHHGDIAGDVGLIKPVGDDVETDEFPLGFPFINFTYRSR